MGKETDQPTLPVIIQGGMGVGISHWELARAVAIAGRDLDTSVLGVVSGTGVEVLLVRRLQDGDSGGHMRRALAAFPDPQIANNILETYFGDTSRSPYARYKNAPPLSDLLSSNPNKVRAMQELSIAANFVEVWLAKEGHDGQIGINHLEKIQMLHLPRLYGAMLAGVDYVLEGAGIPDQVPGVLDSFSNQEPAKYKIDVEGSKVKVEMILDPESFGFARQLKRPTFLAIIASNVLAKALVRDRVSGRVDGFVIEGPTAGGHNAPPRHEHEYGEKDKVDLDKIRALGLPYWLAGSYGSPERLTEARAQGATGIQVGTIFALCDESGMRDDLKRQIRQQIDEDKLEILTSFEASPTGFPFKIAQIAGTLFEQRVYKDRRRRCSIGHLVRPYQTPAGKIGFRCPAEPKKAYVQKGGKPKDAEGSMCICNGLSATAGVAQHDKLGSEPPIITLGDDVGSILKIPRRADGSYTAKDALAHLLGK